MAASEEVSHLDASSYELAIGNLHEAGGSGHVGDQVVGHFSFLFRERPLQTGGRELKNWKSGSSNGRLPPKRLLHYPLLPAISDANAGLGSQGFVMVGVRRVGGDRRFFGCFQHRNGFRDRFDSLSSSTGYGDDQFLPGCHSAASATIMFHFPSRVFAKSHGHQIENKVMRVDHHSNAREARPAVARYQDASSRPSFVEFGGSFREINSPRQFFRAVPRVHLCSTSFRLVRELHGPGGRIDPFVDFSAGERTKTQQNECNLQLHGWLHRLKPYRSAVPARFNRLPPKLFCVRFGSEFGYCQIARKIWTNRAQNYTFLIVLPPNVV